MKAKIHNMKKGFKRNITPLVILNIGILIYFYPLITNNTTPGGDGSRIFPYLQFVDSAESLYPVWNPYKSGGVPTLADPERFIWLAKIIDTDSNYKNLEFNLIYMLVIMLVAFTTYILAREVNISQYGAVIVGLIFCYSFFFNRWVYCGRINFLLSFAMLNIALLSYIRFLTKKGFLYLLITSFLAGKLMHDMGYYGIVAVLPIMGGTGYYYNRRYHGVRRSIQRLLLQLILIGISGILLYAVFLFPLIGYMLPNLSSVPPYMLLDSMLPRMIGFVNVFFPLYEIGLSKTFMFVSPLCLPLLVFYFWRMKEYGKNASAVYLVFLAFTLVFLLGSVYPFKYVVDVFVGTPVLNQIRQAGLFYYMLTLSMAFLCGYGYDSIDGFRVERKYHNYISVIVLSIIVVIVALLDAGSYLRSHETVSFGNYMDSSSIFSLSWNNSGKLLILFIILLFPYSALKEGKYIKIYLVVLLFVQVSLFKVDVMSKVRPVDNKVKIRKFEQILRNDKSYYAIWGLGNWSKRSIGMPKVRALNGFSMYFSREHRWQLSSLLGKEAVALRPHWTEGRNEAFHKWNKNIVRLLGIKYIMTPARYSDERELLKDWDEVMAYKNGKKLWRVKEWESPLRVMDTWEVITKVEDVLTEMRKADFEPHKKVFLGQEPNISVGDNSESLCFDVAISKYVEDEIIMDVKSNKDGILFVPEYYDRGWKACVDGESIEIIRADASFRAIPITKGAHIVTMHYSPYIVYVGAAISLMSIVTGLLASVVHYKKRKPLSRSQ